MHGIITTNHKSLLQRYIIKRLLTVYKKILGTRSYGGDASILRHMNLCRIFNNIQSITYNHRSGVYSLKLNVFVLTTGDSRYLDYARPGADYFDK